MKRRVFLKYLSSIPLIGIPVKALAKEKYGKTEFFDSEEEMIERITGQSKDPYEDVAEHLFKTYWNDSAEMNAKWMKRKS